MRAPERRRVSTKHESDPRLMQILQDARFMQKKSPPAGRFLLTKRLRCYILSGLATLAGVAQSVEQLICNQQVGGSSPSTSSTVRIEYGGFPEWPKGTDCKSAGDAFGGSNPPSPTKAKTFELFSGWKWFRMFLLFLRASEMALIVHVPVLQSVQHRDFFVFAHSTASNMVL